jgi:ribokinase
VEFAKKFGVKVIFNPAPARPLPKIVKDGVSIFTPNEFEEVSIEDVSSEVVTTLGAQGCRIRSTGEIVPAPTVKAVDSTGAGDTFNAVLAVRLAEGEGLCDACAAANAAASQSVAVRYVMPSLPKREGKLRPCRSVDGVEG